MGPVMQGGGAWTGPEVKTPGSLAKLRVLLREREADGWNLLHMGSR